MVSLTVRHTVRMATAVHIPVSEYLATSYRPDCDYVDGEVKQRNLGEQPHAIIQGAINAIFRQHRRAWGIRALPEQRVQVSPTRYRIPDVCVVASSDPIHPVLGQPPLLCVEVLSPNDTFQSMHVRVEDYLRMGVPHVWIIDPISQEVWTATASSETQPLQGEELTIPGTSVRISLPSIFEELDEAVNPTEDEHSSLPTDHRGVCEGANV